ncbi:MAG TPA: hypothetical protein VJ208_02590 [Candidatus Nanoarchaeia archaeon]|nr:hypothetical protein [Candidatus Nanoarchaeia archaeon]
MGKCLNPARFTISKGMILKELFHLSHEKKKKVFEELIKKITDLNN